jgi:hypothetical protein
VCVPLVLVLVLVHPGATAACSRGRSPNLISKSGPSVNIKCGTGQGKLEAQKSEKEEGKKSAERRAHT